jgi:hypothetical protein
VLAGVLAGCNSTSESQATANSTLMTSDKAASPGDIASLKKCLVTQGATVATNSPTRWRIHFADGYSIPFGVPRPGQRVSETVFLSPDNSTAENHDLQVLIACVRKAFG